MVQVEDTEMLQHFGFGLKTGACPASCKGKDKGMDGKALFRACKFSARHQPEAVVRTTV
jgi:hypothetical protein